MEAPAVHASADVQVVRQPHLTAAHPIALARVPTTRPPLTAASTEPRARPGSV